jgi:hypothetical protein
MKRNSPEIDLAATPGVAEGCNRDTSARMFLNRNRPDAAERAGAKRHQKAAEGLAEGQNRDTSPLVFLTRQGWDRDVICYDGYELSDFVEAQSTKEKKATQSDLLLIHTNSMANWNVMPYMVHNRESVAEGGCALSHDLLFDLYKDDGGRKLHVFLVLVSCVVFKDDILAGAHVNTNNRFLADAASDRAFPDSNLALLILLACGPRLLLALTPDEVVHADTLFGLQHITVDEQAVALATIIAYWETDGNRLLKWRATMPKYGTVYWWMFVGQFLRTTVGFDVQKQKGMPDCYKLVTSGFWKVHGIDANQVGLARCDAVQRTSLQRQSDPSYVGVEPLLHKGRPYGVLPQCMHTCLKCVEYFGDTAPQPCVRQNGTEWLCTGDFLPHRDFKTPVDTGYLDEVKPVSSAERKSDQEGPGMGREEFRQALQDQGWEVEPVQVETLSLADRQLFQTLNIPPEEMFLCRY